MQASTGMGVKRLLMAGALGLALYAGYKAVKSGSPKKGVETVIEVPATIVKETVKETEKVSKKVAGAALNAPKKGSEAAKEWARKMKLMREEKRKARTLTPTSKPSEVNEAVKDLRTDGAEKAKTYLKHKGHKTKKGLSQDQKLASKEPHEVRYRKIVEGMK